MSTQRLAALLGSAAIIVQVTIYASPVAAMTRAPIAPVRIAPSSPGFGVFDSFERTVAGDWGTGESGQPWYDNSFRENGRTSAEAGNSMDVDSDTGSGTGTINLGTQEPVWMLSADGPWRQPFWTMTATFSVTGIPNQDNHLLELGFWVFQDAPLAYGDATRLLIRMGSDTSPPFQAGVTLSGVIGNSTSSTLPETTIGAGGDRFTAKWMHVWGVGSYAKVWRDGDPEPGAWQVTRDASTDPVPTGDNTAFQIEAFGPGTNTAQVRIYDLAFDGSVTGCGGDQDVLPATESGSPGDEVTVKYDPGLLVDPTRPNAVAAAQAVASAVQKRGQAAYDRYSGTGTGQFGLEPPAFVEIDLTCHIKIGPYEVPTVAQTLPNLIRYRSDFLRSADGFDAAVASWVGGAFTPPDTGWSTTIDHEMFHAFQDVHNHCFLTYCAVVADTLTESGATAAQDLFPDWDDRPDAPGASGTYMSTVKSSFLNPVRIDGSVTKAIDPADQSEYGAAAILQYWGERYGPQATADLETRVAQFLDELNRAENSQNGRYAEALAAGNAPDGGDPIEALRDFYLAAYGADKNASAPYQILDSRVSNDGTGVPPAYPPFTPIGPPQGETQLAPTQGQVVEFPLSGATDGSFSLHFSARSLPGAITDHFESSYVGVGYVTAANQLIVNPDDNFGAYVYADDLVKHIRVSGATKIVVVVVASERGIKYSMSLTPDSTTAMALLAPAPNAHVAANPLGPLQIDVSPMIDNVLVQNLAANQVTFTIGGHSDFDASVVALPDRYRFVLRPRSPLPLGSLDVTANFSNTLATAGNAFDVSGGNPPSGPRIVPSVSGGQAGTPIQIQATATATDAISGLQMTAVVSPPVGQPRTVRLFDDGRHADGQSGDGTFGAVVWGTSNPGSYNVSIGATGVSGGSQFNATDTETTTLPSMVDADADGVADAVEARFGASPTDPSDGARDDDHDGVGLAAELAAGTDPFAWDSDGGGESDTSEISHGGNPFDPTDDAALSTALIEAQPLDGRLVRVGLGTVDGMGVVSLSRIGPDGIVSLGSHAGTGEEITDGPLPAGDYAYLASAQLNGKIAGPASVQVKADDDVTAPTFTLVANSNRSSIGSQTIPITFANVSEPVTGYRLATSLAALQTASWQPFVGSTTIVVAGNGPQTIFGQLRDAAGNASMPTGADVTVDLTPPSSSAQALPQYVSARSVSIPWSASDTGSGVAYVTIIGRSRTTANGAWSAWTSFGTFSSSPALVAAPADGWFEFYSIAADRAGNLEADPQSADAATIVDTGQPSSSVGTVPSTTTTQSLSVSIGSSDAVSGVSAIELWYRYRPTATGSWTAWSLATSGPMSPLTFSFPNGDGYYELYSVAVDAAGNRESAPSTADAATQRLPAVSLGTASAIGLDQSGHTQQFPDVAIGPSGAAYVVWNDDSSSSRDVFFSRRDPSTGSWSTRLKLNSATGGSTQQIPAVSVDDQDQAYVVWTEAGTDPGDIYFSKRSATGTWSTKKKVNSTAKNVQDFFPDIAVTPSGTAVAVWSSNGSIYSARLAAGSSNWSASWKVNSPAAVPQWSQVAIDAAGNAYAVWTDTRSGNEDVWAAKLPSGSTTWTSEHKVSDDPGTAAQNFPTITVDGSNVVTVEWQDARGGTNGIRMSRSTDGGSTWSASISLDPNATGSGFRNAVGATSTGELLSAWTNGGGHLSAVVRHASGSYTAIEAVAPPGVGGQFDPAVAMRGSSAIFVWIDSRSPGAGVYGVPGTANP